MEKAETFGSVELEVVDCIFVSTTSPVFKELATVISTFGSSTVTSTRGVFSVTCLTTSTIE